MDYVDFTFYSVVKGFFRPSNNWHHPIYDLITIIIIIIIIMMMMMMTLL